MKNVNEEIAELKEAVRQAHETLKDLRAERKEIENKFLDLGSVVDDAVGKRINLAVSINVEELEKATSKAMRDSVARVVREFDRLAEILLGVGDVNRGTLEQRITAYRKHLDET
jgi:chromosome segregation ATPase